MIRRFSAALIGLALCLPVLAAPVAAHGATSFTVEADVLADDTVVGYVVNHTSSRRFNVTVTATYDTSTTPGADHTETAVVFVSNLAPHNRAPFVLEPEADVSAMPTPTFTATGAITGTKPTGGLHVEPCDMVGDTCTGSITNDGALAANNVEVYATRGPSDASHTAAAESANILIIASGATVPYTITFPAGSSGDAWNLIAKTNSGAFYTSWNNYFGDLSQTSESFVDEVAWMADEGITSGCGDAIFCPRSSVTRAQMAVFLDKALDLDDAPAAGFTDISTLSPAFQQAINNLAASGITAGCFDDGVTKRYCPSQSVTRGQMSKFIVTGYGDPNIGNRDIDPIPVVGTGSGSFTDDDDHFSEQYNEAMSAKSITSGCATGKFCPGTNVLREQMAVFLFRADALPVRAP